MASNNADAQSQPWVSLPAEAYILQHWDSQATSSGPETYERLIQQFLDDRHVISDGISGGAIGGQEVSPSTEQIDNILRPWRSEQFRKIAHALRNDRTDEVVVLRTHYSDDPTEDQVMQKIKAENADRDPNHEERHEWWQFLDDRNFYDFKTRWDKIYDILPELTSRGLNKESNLSAETFQEAIENEKEYDMDSTSYVQEWAQLSGHAIAIVDQETFATGKLNLLFLDAVGNVVRSARIDAVDMDDYRQTSFRGSMGTWQTWEDGEVGEKYQPDGIIGSVLQQRLAEAKAAEEA